LRGEVVNVIEAFRVLKIAWSSDFGRQFEALAVVQRKWVVFGFEVDRDAHGGFWGEIEGKLLAVGGKYRRVGHAAGQQNSFLIIGGQLRSMGLAVADLYRDAGQSESATKGGKPQSPCRSGEQDYAEEQRG
jgi:hypothetical protein